MAATARGDIDLVVDGGLVVTMDAEHRVFEGGIAIDDGKIVALGDVSGYRGREIIDAGGCAVIPGLINAHTHAPMALFRGVADDLPLKTWLEEHIFPAEREFLNAGFCTSGTRLACLEWIRSGTTTFCDMYFFEREIGEAAASAGIRCVMGEGVVNFPSPNCPDTERTLAYIRDLAAEVRADPLLYVTVAPHAPYTATADDITAAKELADDLGATLTMHVAETEWEVQNTLQETGKTPFEYLDSLGVLDDRFVAFHAVHLSDAELDLVAERNAAVVHCPESNMKLASGIAPVPKLVDKGVRVGLGTDGAASNNDLALWGEMDSAAKLHKVAALDPTVMPARTVVEMATIGGARALGLDGELGSLEVGKAADLAVVDLGSPNLVPMYDIYSHLVYAAGAADVRDTICNGRVLMRESEVLTLEESTVKEEARRIAGAVKKFLQSS